MNKEEGLNQIINYWIEKSTESLKSAEDELKAERLSFSVNRIYYSCFYIVSAFLLQKGLMFKKHSGVRACFHEHLVKSGLVGMEEGKFYDKLFGARLKGDYVEFTHFEKEEVKDWLKKAKEFVNKVRRLIEKSREK
jgi:hypothetical protein